MKWIQLVTNSYSLIAFALATIVSFIGKQKPRLWPIALSLAIVVIIGGLLLAYKQVQSAIKPIPAKSKEPIEVRQETHGQMSPVIQGVQGNVTIIQNQKGSGK